MKRKLHIQFSIAAALTSPTVFYATVDVICRPSPRVVQPCRSTSAQEVRLQLGTFPNQPHNGLVIKDVQNKIKPPGPADLLNAFDVRIGTILDLCWSIRPEGRPTMIAVVEHLESMIWSCLCRCAPLSTRYPSSPSVVKYEVHASGVLRMKLAFPNRALVQITVCK